MREALEERERLMQQRITTLVQTALERPEPWMARLGETDPHARAEVVEAVVAYRDRWGITSASPLGEVPVDDAQRIDYERTRSRLVGSSHGDEDLRDTHRRSRQTGLTI